MMMTITNNGKSQDGKAFPDAVVVPAAVLGVALTVFGFAPSPTELTATTL
jgi:hypothetical protein